MRVRRRAARPLGRQARRLQALHRPSVGVPRHRQGDARDRHHARFHRRRRQGGRHRRGAARVHRPYRHAAARRPDVRALRAGRRRACATGSSSARPARSPPPSTWRASWRSARTGATPRAASCSPSAASRRSTAIPDHCPTGVATQDPLRQRAIVVPDKSRAGRELPSRDASRRWPSWSPPPGSIIPRELRPHHFMQRAAPDRVVTFAELYRPLPARRAPGRQSDDPVLP